MDEIHAIVDEMLEIERGNIERYSADVREQVANSQSVILMLFKGIMFAVLIAGPQVLCISRTVAGQRRT